VPASTSIRKLIEQALEEAREEFADIVKRKLDALMGEAEPAPRQRASKPTPRHSSVPSQPHGKRNRTPENAMAELRSRVLAAMPVGEPLKRARILELARLSRDDAGRVASVLKKLKDEGVLSMRGAKASATYTRKG
jgi:hypothetical protein